MDKNIKENVVSRISNLASDYKCNDNCLSHEEALELNKMLQELKQLQEYRGKWIEMTDVIRDDYGNRLELGNKVDFEVDVTHWGRHRNGIDPNNLKYYGDNLIAKMTGTLNFDEDGRQLCIDTDYYYLPSIYVSCIEEGSLALHIGKELDSNKSEEESEPLEDIEM